MRTKDEVTYAFTPQKVGVSEQQWLLRIEKAFIELATDIVDLVPECADRTAALRKLLESKMTCSQAITHYKPAAQAQAAPVSNTEKKSANKK